MLTQNDFLNYKQAYDVYGTTKQLDKYGNEYTVRDDTAKCQITVMWQVLTDTADIAEYGAEVSSMYFCILYDDAALEHGDVVIIRGDEYEIAGIKHFNMYDRIDVRKKKV